MGDKEKTNLSEYLDLFSEVIKNGVPYRVLPFVEIVDGIGQKIALKISEKYTDAPKILAMLSDPDRIRKELPEIEGIGRTLTDRVVENQTDLIAGLQKKITLWGDFTFT